MHVIYDNLIAILAAGFLLTLLVQLSRDSNDARLDSTKYYANRVQTTALIETIQRDFRNLGAGIDAANTMIVEFEWDEDDVVKTFEFKASLDPDLPTQIDQVRYELHELSSSQSNCDTGVTCFEIRRYVKNGVVYDLDGGSQASLTEFVLDLKDGNGMPVGANLDDTREIEVKLAALSPFGEDQLIKRTRWQSRFRPPNLLRRDN